MSPSQWLEDNYKRYPEDELVGRLMAACPSSCASDWYGENPNKRTAKALINAWLKRGPVFRCDGCGELKEHVSLLANNETCCSDCIEKVIDDVREVSL